MVPHKHTYAHVYKRVQADKHARLHAHTHTSTLSNDISLQFNLQRKKEATPCLEDRFILCDCSKLLIAINKIRNFSQFEFVLVHFILF